MTEVGKLALAVAMLNTAVNQLFDTISHLEHRMQDLEDIFRGCACFGVDDGTEAT